MKQEPASHIAVVVAAKIARGRPFTKGPDPRRNSGGRLENSKSLTYQLREMFAGGKEASELAGELRDLTRSPDPRIRLAAIKEVFERCDGKAPETLNLSGEVGMPMSDLQQIRAGRRLLQWLAKYHPKEIEQCLEFLGIRK